MKEGKAWVGDEVFDKDAEQLAIVHDVRQGVFVLRPVNGWHTWTNPQQDRLTVTTPREDRVNS
ncbi:hypothetical protein [Streptomyces sp. NPDC003717]|uniref:hypothetical protein n=1 Tax=Streptomyces sp. NPDC003717 TaxID=3154276 RepID=UPI0033BAE5E0